MLVKARYNIKDSSGWHNTGDVFETEDNLGKAVEVLMDSAKEPESVPEETPVPEKPVRKTAGRRKATAK